MSPAVAHLPVLDVAARAPSPTGSASTISVVRAHACEISGSAPSACRPIPRRRRRRRRRAASAPRSRGRWFARARSGLRGIAELVDVERAGDLRGESRRHVLVIPGWPLVTSERVIVDLGAERLEMQHFFCRHLVGDHQQHAIALRARHQREAEAGVAGGRLDHASRRACSRPSCSAAAIIDRAMRSLIEPPGFWLSSLTNRRQRPVSSRVSLDQRGVADETQDSRVAAESIILAAVGPILSTACE